MFILRLLAGFALLVFGRPLYWLFAALMGFLVGFDIAAVLLQARPEWVVLVAALIGGVIGALLGLLVQRVAIAIVGFIAGGYVAASLLLLVVPVLGVLGLTIVFIVGGTIGAIFASVAFDWALIVLSSIAGAAVIVNTVHLARPVSFVVLLVLIVAGIIVQALLYTRASSSASTA